jgi:hypothetical protein
MIFWLRRAAAPRSPHAQCPRGALPVGDDPDLDMPGAGDQAFQEDGAGAGARSASWIRRGTG